MPNVEFSAGGIVIQLPTNVFIFILLHVCDLEKRALLLWLFICIIGKEIIYHINIL